MEPDLKAQATWHVLRRIKNSLTDSTNDVLFNLYEFGGDAPNSDLQYDALAKLRDQGIITFNENTPTAFIERHADGGIALQYTQYRLAIVNGLQLNKSYDQHKALAETLTKENPVVISYENTRARINGVFFNLRGRNKRIFDLLYKRVNQWVPQADLLKAARYDKAYDSKAANLDFNTYIGNLRKALGLKPWHIAVSDKHAMLKCNINKN